MLALLSVQNIDTDTLSARNSMACELPWKCYESTYLHSCKNYYDCMISGLYLDTGAYISQYNSAQLSVSLLSEANGSSSH